MFNPEEILPGPHLADLSEIISKRTGLNFPEERWPDLARSLRAAAHDLGFMDTKSCIEGLLSASLEKREIDILARHLTVGETYFFRDEKLFEALEGYVLRPLIETRRENDRFLGLWSAGCASGEEAYSLAILVKKMIPDLENWRIVIQATDINPHFLKKARKGIYSEWSFRNTPPRFKGQYFTKTSEGRWEVLPEIRQMVHFSNHNLAEDPYPWSVDRTRAIDIIVCRNVLMYFTQEKGKDVIQGFHHCLQSEGWLVVSPWETPDTLSAGFKAIRLPDAVLYQKAVPGSGIWDLGSGTGDQGSGTRCRGSGVNVRGPGVGIRGFAPKEQSIHHVNVTAAPWLKASGSACQPAPHRPSPDFRPPAPDPRSLPKDPRPQTPAPHKDLARHYANMGMLPEAMEHCQRAIFKDEFNPELHFLLASIQQEQGQNGEAISSLRKVLYLDHNFILAYFALGNLSALQGKARDAEKCFGNALHLLEKIKKEDLLPGSGGMTAGSLAQIIHSVRRKNQHGPKKA